MSVIPVKPVLVGDSVPAGRPSREEALKAARARREAEEIAAFQEIAASTERSSLRSK